MKKVIIRLFVELYHWQNDKYGETNLPVLTALLLSSGLQFLNLLSVISFLYPIFGINVFSYLSKNHVVGLTIPAAILIMNYIIVRPVKMTIKNNPIQWRKITPIFVLLTITLTTISVVLIIRFKN